MIFDLGFIKIDIGWLITFFSGALFTLILVTLWYLVAVLKSLNKDMKRNKVQEEDIDELEIKWLINDAHKLFKQKDVRDSVGYGQHLLNVSLELGNDIATKFYPRSKYPYLELSLDESLVLLRYVSNRFDELLNKPILKMFKGLTLRRLITLNDAKVKLDNNLLVKATNKFKVNEIFKQTMLVLNVVNPIYWFRRLVLDNVTQVIMIKLGLVVISLTGEETYKIYSKKVFNQDKELNSGIEEIYKDIENSLKEDKDQHEET
ncbi:Uncharacterised protein [Acholeplasma oculi]|uniref:Uncharacterized protein n=1 Tax=Acholeplasma oculi TaxID=35623 RepID=A0A061ABA6_9MOLU|nr:hypothetical protein [Acholeplasma oculi]CDR31175.1 hypothetical protein Aocu_11020 [Acholeplasma oculi]SKC37747.1 hypothetical protein SAMN02745122_0532 [Acholeplasma oculi]SUT91049.1 Uncharacterised protein [Acholeplasma oculi]